MKKILIWLIDLYKKYISPLTSRHCRFTPSCSTYMKEAIEKYGVIKGVGKGILRILRCNPLFKGGYDPLK